MVYYNPYKRIIYAFTRALKTFLSCLFSKSLLIIIIIFLLVFIFVTDKKVYASTPNLTPSRVEDVYQEMITEQEKWQNDFILFSYYPFFENTNAWNTELKPFFDVIKEQHLDVYIEYLNPSTSTNTTNVRYYIYTYRGTNNPQASYTSGTWTSSVTNITYNTQYLHLSDSSGTKRYTVNFNSSLNTITVSNGIYISANIPIPVVSYRSPMWLHFMEMVYYSGNGINYSSVLNDIDSYVSSIDTTNTNISSQLSIILSSLNSVAQNTSTNYSTQLSSIASKVDDLIDTNEDMLDDLDTLNTQMDTLNESIEDMNDFFTDTSYDSNTITNNMPTNNQPDITADGFDNIFTTLRNTFTGTNYQDIVITVPFTNGGYFTIPSNITENIVPNVIKTLIRLVYWYLISRYIVKDIASYIEKAKSGDIFDSSDSNIKTEML